MATILIIEDQADLRNLYKMILEQAGHKVFAVPNGVEGLHYLKQNPDLVILDLSMPMASGDVVLGFIRSTPEMKKLPVMVVSALPNAASIARDLGADLCLHKPVSIDEITEAVNKLLEQTVS
jgi:DNA-binding response OmpR family regulator